MIGMMNIKTVITLHFQVILMRVHVHLIIDNSMLYSFLLLQSQLLTTNLFKPPPCEDLRITTTTLTTYHHVIQFLHPLLLPLMCILFATRMSLLKHCTNDPSLLPLHRRRQLAPFSKSVSPIMAPNSKKAPLRNRESECSPTFDSLSKSSP